MKSKCLFLHRGKCITSSDFSSALKLLGVRQGDTVFVHAGVGAFGKLASGASREEVCQGLVNAFRKSVGSRGTIVMPTFTYAFCKDAIYDWKKSPSEVGTLSEYFRTRPGVLRSLHPIFSVAASGPRAEELTSVDMDSFGPQSVFAKLNEVNAVILFVGATFQRCTFLHYVEQSHKIPYRFLKKFPGTVIDGKKRRKVEATYLVMPLRSKIENYNDPIEKILRRKKLLRSASVASGSILAVRAQDVFREGMRLFDRDPYALTRPRLKRS